MTTPIALQLYTLRDALADDFDAIVKQVAETGYVAVEPFGGMPRPVTEAAQLFNQLGLQVHSAHLPPPLGDDKNRILDDAGAYRLQHFVIPYQPPEEFATLDKIKATCDMLNQANQIVQSQGMTLHYHNHWWEFEEIEGRLVFDHMLDLVEPTLHFEIDTYWVKVGGADPVQVIERLGSRAPLLHIKDGPATQDDPMVAVGQGTMDFYAVAKAGGEHTALFIVELDRCATDMMTAVKESYTYLTSEGLAHGRDS